MKKLLFLLLLPALAFGQGIQIEKPKGSTTAHYGYLEYLPDNYGCSDKMPLVIFLHGYGKIGNGTTDLHKVSDEGLPLLLKNKTLPHTSEPFICLSIQSATKYIDHNAVNAFLTYAIRTYKIDTTRMYLTGLSGGATCGYNYMRTYNRFAAAVLIAGYGLTKTICDTKAPYTPVWAFHGTLDATINITGSSNYIYRVNQCPSKKEVCKITAYDGVGHNSWDRTYNLSGMNNFSVQSFKIAKETIKYDPFDISIYEWLLKHKK